MFLHDTLLSAGRIEQAGFYNCLNVFIRTGYCNLFLTQFQRQDVQVDIGGQAHDLAVVDQGIVDEAYGAAWVSTGAIMGTELASQFVWGRNLYCFHQGHIQGLSLQARAAAQRIFDFGCLD